MLYRKKTSLSKSLARQAVGVREVDSEFWLVSFMDHDLGHIDLEEGTSAAPRKPFRAKSVTYVLGTNCYTYVSVPDTVVLVRKGGLEPPCPCGRSHLKAVRLPISPLPLVVN